MNAKTNKLLVFVVTLAMTVGLFSGVALGAGEPAFIGETGYASINAAIAAAGNGAVIDVKKSVAEDVVVEAGKTITLNIQEGVTVSGNKSHTIENHGALTIKGSGTIQNTIRGKGALANYPGASLTLDGCTVTGNTWYVIKNLGTMVINNTKMVQEDANSSAIANGYYGNTGGAGDLNCKPDGNNPSLTIKDGAFSGGMNTVKNDDYGVLVIDNGTFTNTDGPAVLNWNEATINGGVFEVSDKASSVIANGYLNDKADKGILTVNGGTFTAANNGTGSILAYGITSTKGGSTIFKGGTFNGRLETNADYPSTPVVWPGATINAPAGDTSADKYKAKFEVDGKYYTTLGDAVAAVPANGTQTTVKLLCDAAGGGVKVEAGQNIVFDFGGHTYTVGAPTVGSTGTETNAFQLLKGSTVTMKNGTVKASNYENLKILIQNYCGVRLENVTLDASGAPQCQYVLSNNCGNTVITGNSQILAAPGQKAFDLWYGMHESYKDGVTVTFDKGFTGRVEGIVEYGAKNTWDGWTGKTVLTMENGNTGSFDIKIEAGSTNFDLNTANVKIAGGSFDKAVNEKYLAEGFVLKPNADGSYTVVDKANTAKLTITTQPADQTVTVGQQATFTIAATGEAPLYYCWEIDRGNGWEKPDSANNQATYTTAATALGNDGFKYRCTVTDSIGNTVTSNVVTLHVSEKPVAPVTPNVPKTGDSSMPMLWLALMLLGAAGIAVLCKKARKA